MDILKKIGRLVKNQEKNIVLSNSNLSEFPLEILRIKDMTHLNLSGNKITEIPESIYVLKELTYLNLSKNRITNLPDEFFKRLNKLKHLNLEGNNIMLFPSSISELLSLEILDLSNNHLVNIDRRINKLLNLKILFIGGNKIEKVPIEIINSQPHKSTLSAIKNYFDALDRGTSELYEAKLILVGKGSVGKTSLSNKLIDSSHQLKKENTTRGIDIFDWEFDIPNTDKKFRINIWDFGGQQIYYGTHQFFLTKRSFYLLVWDARQEEDYITFDYWLNIIKLLSDKSPVAVIQNKADERIKEIPQIQLKEKFPNITEFFKTSCSTNKGIEDLKSHIKKRILRLPHIGDILPSVWVQIRKSLGERPDNHISYESYLEICNSYDLNKEKADALSGYLHDLGSILHFAEDPILMNTVILKPDWATRAVYLIVDNFEVGTNFGRISYQELKNIWIQNGYKNKHVELLQLMKKFEICFEIKEKNETIYVIPKLLKADKPVDFKWEEKNELRLEYHYIFKPAGIFNRLMVRLNAIIEDKDKFWSNGVILSHKKSSTRALIENRPLERKTVVRIAGEDKQGLLSIIRFHLDSIHDSLNNPEVYEMVSCICEKCQNGEKKMYRFNELKDALAHGKRTIECRNSWTNVNIKAMLYGLDNPIEIPNLKKAKKSSEYTLRHPNEYYEDIINNVYNSIEELGKTKNEIDFIKAQLKVIIDELADNEEREQAFYGLYSFFNKNIRDINNSVIGGALTELGKLIIGY